jgi:hypothetical protein
MEHISIRLELALTGFAEVTLYAFVSSKLDYGFRTAIFTGYRFCGSFFCLHL